MRNPFRRKTTEEHWLGDVRKALPHLVEENVLCVVATPESMDTLMTQDCRVCDKPPTLGQEWFVWGEPMGGYVAMVSLCSPTCVEKLLDERHREAAESEQGLALAILYRTGRADSLIDAATYEIED